MKPIDPAFVEFNNDAFYLAFNNRDLTEMERLWAIETPVVCIHPGWQPITDREEIIRSYESIFDNQGNESIICHPLHVYTQGDIFSVLCYEQLGDGWLIATNNYMVESGEIKLIHHQASQCMDAPDIETPIQSIQ